MPEPKSVSPVMLGCGLGCLGLVVLPCLIQLIVGVVVMLGGVRPPPPPPSATVTADASREAVQVNKVVVRVTGGSVDKANFGSGLQLTLRLTLRLTNKGGANVVYNGWGIAGNGGYSPGWALALKDNLGNPYQMIQAGGPVEGQVRQTTLEPGKGVDDVLLFQPPLPKIEFLELTLPGGNLGGGEAVSFRIPIAMLQRPDSVPPGGSP